MVTCACGNSTEGDPWVNGWARSGCLWREHGEQPVQIQLWRCPACQAATERRQAFADGVAHEEQFE